MANDTDDENSGIDLRRIVSYERDNGDTVQVSVDNHGGLHVWIGDETTSLDPQTAGEIAHHIRDRGGEKRLPEDRRDDARGY